MKQISLLLVCLLVSICSFAQPGGPRQQRFSPEEFKQQFENYITQHAELTNDEAKKVMPLLHEALAKQHENMKQIHALMRTNCDQISEAECERVLIRIQALESSNKKIEIDYAKKLHCLVSWNKIFKIKKAIARFQSEALRKFSPRK